MPKNIPIWIPTATFLFQPWRIRWQSIFPTRLTLCKTPTSQPLGSSLDPKSFFLGHRNKHPRWTFLGFQTPDPDVFFSAQKRSLKDPNWKTRDSRKLLWVEPLFAIGNHAWGSLGWWDDINGVYFGGSSLKTTSKAMNFFGRNLVHCRWSTGPGGFNPTAKFRKTCKTWDQTIMTNHSVAKPCCPCRPFGGQGWKYRSGKTNPGGGGSFAWPGWLGGQCGTLPTIVWPICWLEGVAVVSAASSLRSSKSMIAMWLLRKKPDEMPKVLKKMENHSLRNASSFPASQKAEKYLGKEAQMSKQAECHCHDRVAGTRSNSSKL